MWRDTLHKFFAPGLIVTPFLLIDEILDKLTVDWSNPNLMFLDPCCGSGRFLLAIKHRLLDAGHSEQHIIENMIYGCDIDPINITGTLAMLGANAYNHNIKCTNSLTEKWTVKFDVVIGNPSYQDDNPSSTVALYDQFYYLATRLSTGIVSMVAPTMWLNSKKKNLVKLRGFLLTHGLVSVHMINAQQVFGVMIDSCGYTVQNMTLTTTDSIPIALCTGAIAMLPQSGEAAVLTDNPLVVAILEKIKQGPRLGVRWNGDLYSVGNDGTCYQDRASLIQSTQHPHPMYNKVNKRGVGVEIAYSSTDRDPCKYDTRVVFSGLTSRDSLGDIRVLPGDGIQTSRRMLYIPVQDTTQADSMVGYLTSKLFRFILPFIRPNTTNSVSTFAGIARPPLDRVWTDAELYAHFNLTREEIDLIESTVK